MMNDTDLPPDNVHEFTVSELSRTLKRTLEERFPYVRVRGEISGFKRAASGHLYMALKDDQAVLDGVCWKGIAGRLPFKPEDGLEVVATGKITSYPGRSKYQIVIEWMEPAGEGALMALLEERKRKLAAEGLFDPAHKKPIPYLPEVIGVVTSPTGAVIRDILHRLSDRFPRRVLVWPVLVQGQEAAGQVAAAIRGFNALPADGKIPRPDLLIVARGGGSLEDLWAFNEEIVVRAAFESALPLISAVGHETDTTLIDYVSDLRAPTPTAAAEQAVPVREELLHTLGDLDRRRGSGLKRYFERLADRLLASVRGLPRPRDLFSLPEQRFDEISDRLPRAVKHKLQIVRHRFARASGLLSDRTLRHGLEIKTQKLENLSVRIRRTRGQAVKNDETRLQSLSRLLESYSHKNILKRGFAVIHDDLGKPVISAGTVKPGAVLDIEFRDGRVPAVVSGGNPPRKKTKKPAADGAQGSLL